MCRVSISMRSQQSSFFFLFTVLFLLQVYRVVSPHISLTFLGWYHSTFTISLHSPLLFQQRRDHSFSGCFIQLQETPAIRSKYSECIYRIIGKVVVMRIVHLIYILLLYVLCRTMVFLKVLLSTLLEEHKAAIHIFSLFKSNVVKIFSLNGTQSAHGRICSRYSV